MADDALKTPNADKLWRYLQPSRAEVADEAEQRMAADHAIAVLAANPQLVLDALTEAGALDRHQAIGTNFPTDEPLPAFYRVAE